MKSAKHRTDVQYFHLKKLIFEKSVFVRLRNYARKNANYIFETLSDFIIINFIFFFFVSEQNERGGSLIKTNKMCSILPYSYEMLFIFNCAI